MLNNHVDAIGDVSFSNYSHAPLGTLVDVEALTLAESGETISHSEAEAFFQNLDISGLYTETSGLGGEGAFQGSATSDSLVVANFAVAEGETFSFDFLTYLSVEAKEIDNPDVEYTEALLNIGFLVLDTSDPDNVQLLDHADISGYLLSSEQSGSLDVIFSDNFILDYYGYDIDIDFDNGLDFIDFDNEGIYQRTFDQNTNITLVKTSYSVVEWLGDSFINNLGSDFTYGTIWDDLWFGTKQDNKYYASFGDDSIFGGRGDDTLIGAGGDDLLHGGRDDDSLSGGDGDDSVFGDRGDDTLSGGKGDDLLRGGRDDDSLTGENGDDEVFGGRGDDTLSGGKGDDLIRGGRDDDSLTGEDGDDEVFGGRGDDTLNGGKGDDLLQGGRDDDTAIGGDGDDSVFGSRGDDTLSGGKGDDLLKGGRDDDSLRGGDGDDSAFGGRGDDTLNGGKGDDLLQGGRDNDLLQGSRGNDMLRGNDGDDQLKGARDNDTLTGGLGADQFIYESSEAFNSAQIGVDLITDLTVNTDKIVLSQITFNALTLTIDSSMNPNEFEVVATDDLAALSDAFITYSASTGNLFYNQNGSDDGLGEGGQFAILRDIPALTATDFLIIQ